MPTFRLSAVLLVLSLVAVWASSYAGAYLARPAVVQPVPTKGMALPLPPAQRVRVRSVDLGRVEARERPVFPSTARDLFRERERAADGQVLRMPTLVTPAPDAAPGPAFIPVPSLVLAGIAEDGDPGPLVRTAIVSGAAEMWLVREGDVLAGRYRVERIAADAVHLTDSIGGQSRILRLR